MRSFMAFFDCGTDVDLGGLLKVLESWESIGGFWRVLEGFGGSRRVQEGFRGLWRV